MCVREENLDMGFYFLINRDTNESVLELKALI